VCVQCHLQRRVPAAGASSLGSPGRAQVPRARGGRLLLRHRHVPQRAGLPHSGAVCVCVCVCVYVCMYVCMCVCVCI
jgi:hypothetical protein